MPLDLVMRESSIAPTGDTFAPSPPRPARPVVPISLPPLQAPRLLDQVRERIRFLHYSRSTEDVYVHWIRAFVRFHGLRHPTEMGGDAVQAFLSWLASQRHVASSTHRQALSALLFLYSKVLGVQLPWMSEIGRPRSQRRLSVVFTRDEVQRLLNALPIEMRSVPCEVVDFGIRVRMPATGILRC